MKDQTYCIGGRYIGDVGYDCVCHMDDKVIMIVKDTVVGGESLRERIIIDEDFAIQLARAILKHYGEKA